MSKEKAIAKIVDHAKNALYQADGIVYANKKKDYALYQSHLAAFNDEMTRLLGMQNMVDELCPELKYPLHCIRLGIIEARHYMENAA